jgi:hypothetical protein
MRTYQVATVTRRWKAMFSTLWRASLQDMSNRRPPYHTERIGKRGASPFAGQAACGALAFVNCYDDIAAAQAWAAAKVGQALPDELMAA